MSGLCPREGREAAWLSETQSQVWVLSVPSSRTVTRVRGYIWRYICQALLRFQFSVFYPGRFFFWQFPWLVNIFCLVKEFCIYGANLPPVCCALFVCACVENCISCLFSIRLTLNSKDNETLMHQKKNDSTATILTFFDLHKLTCDGVLHSTLVTYIIGTFQIPFWNITQ